MKKKKNQNTNIKLGVLVLCPVSFICNYICQAYIRMSSNTIGIFMQQKKKEIQAKGDFA